MKKNILRTALISLIIIFAATCSALAASSESRITDNLDDNCYYKFWDSPVYSYLVAVDGGYMRVEAIASEGRILVEYLDSKYSLTSSKYITMDLPIFGGFFAGENHYYVVTGQKNPNEDDSVPVFAIRKYSKSWKKIENGKAVIRGGNTTIPFNAGTCRIAEANGKLYIRTSHEMYMTSDGIHHQANVTIMVNEKTMKVEDDITRISNNSHGYTSHSFTQFILIDSNDTPVALDHGDALPRSLTLFKYSGHNSGKSTTITGGKNVKQSNFMEFPDDPDYHYNFTNCEVGGFEEASSNYITAGCANDYSDGLSGNTRNVFINLTDKNDLTNETIWLTDIPEGKKSCGNPQLVKFSSSRFLVIWANKVNGKTNGTVSYVYIDGSGKQLSEIITAEGTLSDCKPIVSKGRARWYTTDRKKIRFYSIDKNAVLRTTVNGVTTPSDPEEGM